jgi:hypothetical protein
VQNPKSSNIEKRARDFLNESRQSRGTQYLLRIETALGRKLNVVRKNTGPRSRGMVFARILRFRLSLSSKRAQGKPGADCARSPRAAKSTGVELQVQPRHPGFPRAMVLRLASCSPR